MSRGVNKAIVLGNLGRDPEMRYSASGAAIANISVATTHGWKDKTTGETNEVTEWHRIVMFGRLAEIAGEYLRKGSQVYIEGRIQTRKWQDQSGTDRYTTEIVANEMQMLGVRGSSPGSDPGNEYDQTPQQNGSKYARGKDRIHAEGAPPEFDDFDDDIPF